jgi:hypothetical protein
MILDDIKDQERVQASGKHRHDSLTQQFTRAPNTVRCVLKNPFWHVFDRIRYKKVSPFNRMLTNGLRCEPDEVGDLVQSESVLNGAMDFFVERHRHRTMSECPRLWDTSQGW